MRSWLSRHQTSITWIASLALMLLVVLNASRSYQLLQQVNQLQRHAQLAQLSASVIHELQRERGMSAGFLGSAGSLYIRQLPYQRQQTDLSLKQLNDFTRLQPFNASTQAILQQLDKRLLKLTDVRRQVDQLNIALDDMLAYYTGHNSLLLDSLAMLIQVSITPEIGQKVVTLSNFARAKEDAGIERAVLNNVFSADQFTPELRIKHAVLMAKQQTFLHSAIVTTTAPLKRTLSGFINSEEQKQVEYYRHIAAMDDAGYQVRAADWFKVATARIDLYRSTEAQVIDGLHIDADQLHNTQLWLFCLNLALMLGAWILIWQKNGSDTAMH